MVNRVVGWVVLVPLCLGLIIFALANRHFVVVNFNPFVPVEGTVAPGVLLGGTATWFAQASHRRGEKHWRREAHLLNGELEKLRRHHGQSGSGPLAEVDDLLELR
jgi:hypothetical protein